jgi:hypothetical protein
MSYPQTAFVVNRISQAFFTRKNWQSLASLILFATNGQLQEWNVLLFHSNVALSQRSPANYFKSNKSYCLILRQDLLFLWL